VVITPQTYSNPRYAYRPAPAREGRHPVVIVGAGLVGLTLAVDLALRGVASVVIDDDDTVSLGSRAICWAKRTLEIFDRLGLGQRLVDKGVTWNLGKVFHRERTLYDFNLLPEAGQSRPAFVNLQQYYVEEWLVARAAELPLIDLRWKHRLVGLAQDAGGVTAAVETADGRYELSADWLVACDGARSTTRALLGLAFEGREFRDRFLIADLLMEADYPAERWFWFDPPFHPGQSVLLHKQADRVWRIDFQLGPDADPEREKDPARVTARLAAMLGPERRFSLEWVSVYSFKCRRLRRFRQGRVLFAGDAAHQVSPFGARGGNSGVQDAENLAWKLAALLRGAAPEALLGSYEAERIPAADENILHSTRATDFITPKSPASRAYRDAVLELAAEAPFARALINSGRLSRAASYATTPLSTPDATAFAGGLPPGAPALDAPVTTAEGADWLLRRLGPDFTLLSFDPAASAPPGVALLRVGVEVMDSEGLLAQRYGAGSTYLLRPDRHVAARWPRFDAAAVAAALHRALAGPSPAGLSRGSIGGTGDGGDMDARDQPEHDGGKNPA
jgi:3-(3-hydroxy-phenyl)propionate hydroxylase